MKTLFISYNAASESLIQSQGIPYLKGLSSKGVGCVLLSFEKQDKNKCKRRKIIDKIRSELSKDRIKWYYLRYHKSPSVPATLFDILTGSIFTFFIVILNRIDIIHARAMIAACMGYPVARLTGKKFVFDERGLMAEEYADGGMWRKGSFLYKITLYLEKKLLKRADAVVVLSENIKNFLVNSDYLYNKPIRARQDITVIPCCVDTGKFSIRPAVKKEIGKDIRFPERFVFLYSGSLGTWYLLEEMIDFFVTAKTIINNAHFFVLTRTAKDIIKELWLKKNLGFNDLTVEDAEFEEMPHFIRLADAGIFFIKPVFSKRSSCPIKFAEYLACGLPVIINSAIGDTDKLVKKYKLGVVVSKFNHDNYISCVNKLLELMRDRDSLAKRCRNVAMDFFHLSAGVNKYFEVYNKLFE